VRKLPVAVLAAAIVSATLGAGQPASASARTTLVLRFTSVTTSEKVFDLPPKGESVGDHVFSTSRLLNAVAQLGKPKGAVVGTDSGTMTFAAGPTFRVDVTTRLGSDTLRMRGVMSIRPGQLILPVTGGTGRFAGARGTMVIRALSSDGRRATNTYRLTF
jgi:allene oxide cyclase